MVAVEAPLEIRVDGTPVVVTMRTPGDDVELAAGFLYTEGIVDDRADLVELRDARTGERAPEPRRARLPRRRHRRGPAARARPTAGRARRVRPRAFRATAACGVCGKQRLEDLEVALPAIAPIAIDDALIESLPARLREHQALFEECGGLHGAGSVRRRRRAARACARTSGATTRSTR